MTMFHKIENIKKEGDIIKKNGVEKYDNQNEKKIPTMWFDKWFVVPEKKVSYIR